MVLVKCWHVVLLAMPGFEAVQVVEETHFSTVKSPNPENQAAFALAEELGRKVDADVLVATPTQMLTALVLKSANQMDLYLNLSGNQNRSYHC